MLPPGWRVRLAAGLSPVVLVTINPYGPLPTRSNRSMADPWTASPHLALQPGSICLATHRNVEVTDTASGRRVPFWPYLKWPTVERRMAPHERRAEIAEVALEILPDAALGPILRDGGGGQAAVARVDLWLPGIGLENVYPLLGGPVTGSVNQPRREGPVRLGVTDGDPDLEVRYPPGPLTRADFPDAPDWVWNQEFRQTLLGAGIERMYLIPIDREGRRFYLCDPPMLLPPTRIEKGKKFDEPGAQIYGASVFEGVTPTGWRYTGVELEEPLREVASLDQNLYASGGFGLAAENPVDFLLKQAGILLTPRARQLLPALTRDFPLSVWLDDQEEGVQTTVHNLLAQTAYVGTWQRGRFDLIPLQRHAPEISVALGRELLFRLAQQEPETSITRVWNAFEVRVGRSGASGEALYTVFRDSSHGPARMQALCRRSEQLYGRRFTAIEAPDLEIEWHEGTFADPKGSPAAERYADSLVRMHAMVHTPHAYKADWLTALSVDLGWRAKLTDTRESLSDTKTRVVGLRYQPDGPEVTLQTRDEEI